VVPLLLGFFLFEFLIFFELPQLINELLLLADKFGSAIDGCQDLLFHEPTMFRMLVVLIFQPI
jgi:hypothetical protein